MACWLDSRCACWAGLREEAANDGRPFRRLVYVKPEEHLDVLVERLVANEVSSAPCLTTEPDGTVSAGKGNAVAVACMLIYVLLLM